MATISEERIELGGFATRALEAGPADTAAGPPLMFLHGFSDSADCWRRLLEQFADRGRRGVALDMPGFGQAGRLDREAPILPQLDAFAAGAIQREAERGGDGEVIVVGNSLGGCVALRAAQEEELPIAGIVPIAPAGLEMARWISIIEREAPLRWLMRSPLPVPEIVVRGVIGQMYRTMAFARPREVDPAAVASFTRHVSTKRDVVRILGTGRRVVVELADAFELERIRCPVLLVWGERDRMVYSSGADRVLREVAGSRIEVIEHCGHCPQVEEPERLAKLLVAFADPVAQAA